MIKRLMRQGYMLMRAAAVASAALALAGCSPDYNWRAVTVGDGIATGFFPDRPRVQERTVSYDGHDIVFSMSAASVAGALFTVSYAVLPPPLAQDAQAAARLGQSVQGSLYQNLGASLPENLPLFGERFDIRGSPAGKPIRLQGAVWLTSGVLVEGAVVADAASYPEEQARQFFQGLQVGR
ncbi:MAG: hypothetical protein WC284_07915 [Candidimonas sp.]|jgi:hypothetical protein